MSDLGKLRWRCRRGCLELDKLLLHYADTAYPSATVADQLAFQHLLELEDSQLSSLLLAGDAVQDSRLAQIVAVIHRTTSC